MMLKRFFRRLWRSSERPFPVVALSPARWRPSVSPTSGKPQCYGNVPPAGPWPMQGLAVTFLFQALSRAPVTVVSPINASSPLITLLLTHLFLRRLESINPLLVVGACLGVGGVVTVVLGTAAG